MSKPRFRIWHKKLQKMAYFQDPHIYTDSPTTHLCFDLTGWEPMRRFCNDHYTLELDCYDDEFSKEFSDNIVLMQSTGLIDKNGKTIFERDVLEMDKLFWGNDEPHPERRAVMEWDARNGSWYFDVLCRNKDVDTEMNVIGNIYENPDLLPSP